MTRPPRLRLTRATLAEGTTALRRRDPRLRMWIDRVGPVTLRRQPHQFAALCRSILSQQIGGAAARSIHLRFLALFAPARSPSPDALLALRPEALRACGISGRKVEYLRALAAAFHDGELARVRLGALDDDEITTRLVRLPGIGQWTAEMFLIFSIGRLDIFSAGDLALRQGVRRVEGKDLTRVEISDVARRWSPYRSVASLYLWKIAHWKDGGA